MAVRELTKAYHPVRIPEDETWTALFSPYFGVDDFRWFLKQAGGLEGFFALNRQLFTAAFDFDAYKQSTAYQMPVYFISGTDDWICPIPSVQAYMEAVAAPDKDLILLDGLPVTSKPDKDFHGFGIKSIRFIAQKYGGHVAISAQQHHFCLHFMRKELIIIAWHWKELTQKPQHVETADTTR